MSEEVVARKRGRPRKSPLPDVISAPSEPQIKRNASTKASTANKTTKAASSSKPSKTTKTKPTTTTTPSKATPTATATKSKSASKETSTTVKSSLKPTSTAKTTPAAPQSSRILKEVEAARAVSTNAPQSTASASAQQSQAAEPSPTSETPNAPTSRAGFNPQSTFETPKPIPRHVSQPPKLPLLLCSRHFAAGNPQSPVNSDAVRRTARYKSASRRITATMVAMPIMLVTGYVLFDRLALGNERRIPYLDMTGPANDGTAGRVQETLEVDTSSRTTRET